MPEDSESRSRNSRLLRRKYKDNHLHDDHGQYDLNWTRRFGERANRKGFD
ncbi:MAG: hypothetical protein ACTSWN_05725 [Promethearchaeota archaeon]